MREGLEQQGSVEGGVALGLQIGEEQGTMEGGVVIDLQIGMDWDHLELVRC